MLPATVRPLVLEAFECKFDCRKQRSHGGGAALGSMLRRGGPRACTSTIHGYGSRGHSKSAITVAPRHSTGDHNLVPKPAVIFESDTQCDLQRGAGLPSDILLPSHFVLHRGVWPSSLTTSTADTCMQIRVPPRAATTAA